MCYFQFRFSSSNTPKKFNKLLPLSNMITDGQLW